MFIIKINYETASLFLGMFWKRTTGTAAIVGVISGLLLYVLFIEFASALFGNETLLYTTYTNGKGRFEIPFQMCIGLSFVITMLLMIVISFAGPKVNSKAFGLDTEMSKLKPQATVLIVILVERYLLGKVFSVKPSITQIFTYSRLLMLTKRTLLNYKKI